MLVQQETAAIHREGRVQRRRACERRRVGHEVLCRDAIWAQDATHVGRFETGQEISAEVATDRATLSTVILAVGAPAAAEDLVGHLERAKVERGGLPLVWQSDGGGANRSAAVASYLERERVVHLLSRPHTPTDNPSAEHKNRELKEEGDLDAAASRTAEAADAALACARRRVDEGRLRASRGWKTAVELDRALPRADALVDRDRFYAEARSAIRAAALGHDDARSRRKAEQDAIWATLERHGLARRHVGLRRTPQPRATPVAHTAAGVE